MLRIIFKIMKNKNPFGMQELMTGYNMAMSEGTYGEGECGESKCSDDKAIEAKYCSNY